MEYRTKEKAIDELVKKLKAEGQPFLLLHGDPLGAGVNIDINGNFNEIGKLLLAMAVYKKELALLLRLVVNKLCKEV